MKMELTQEINLIGQLRRTLSLLSQLGKFKITFFVAVTTSFGYILYAEKVTSIMFVTCWAVFLMASGSSVLNQVQERDLDKIMLRTRQRPIPNGMISVWTALFIGLGLLILGASILYFFSGLIPFYFGVFAFIWYNFIYTPLKKTTAFAIIPGSLVGAIPPIIGWTAAGGNVFHHTALSLAVFFFIWQVPHFWLLLLIYSSEYKNAGLPVLTDIFSKIQLGRISFLWIIALGFSSFMLIIFENILSYYLLFYLGLSFLALIYFSWSLLYKELDKKMLLKKFYIINIYILSIITIISVDKLF